MEGLISRYRNLSVLLLLLAAQLLLLAWQIKGEGDTRLIRIWAVTAVTPIARGIELGRSGTVGLFERVFLLGTLEKENVRLRNVTAQLEIQNQLLKSQMQVGGLSKALLEFRDQIPSKSIPARILGNTPGVQSGVLFIDRGSIEGVRRGMAVVTGDGIAGEVVAAYPTASLIMLATSQGFAAGVVSQKHKVRGLLKGDGSECHIEGIQNEQPVDADEWFYTSGDDRIFPRGLKVGQVRSVRPGREGKEIHIRPIALESDFTSLLVLLDAVHGQIPDPATPASTAVAVLPPPPGEANSTEAPATPATGEGVSSNPATDADRAKDRYRRIAEGQNFQIGATPYRAPDFNKPPGPPKPAGSGTVAPQPGGAAAPAQTAPSATPGSAPKTGSAVVNGAPKAVQPGTPVRPAPTAKPDAAKKQQR
jgi:rod shape-determining protein MreC